MAPMRSRAPQGPDSIVPREPHVSLSNLRILVVEDEVDARELLQHVLQEAGARVTEAPEARTALELLQHEPFDVIVSDIGMPVMDGFDLIRTLRARPTEHGGKVPAIALTAFTRAVDRTTALRAGFQAHVPKPVDSAELIAVVASLCGRI
jgi:CheY-like chemotaxis protein